MKKLAIISTHPIQYNAPLFRLLAERGNIGIKVFYTWSQSVQTVEDTGFGKTIQWDIPLLEGYDYEVVENTSQKPGNKSFWGIQNPTLIYKLKKYDPDAILIYGWNFKSHFQVMRYFKGKISVWFRGDSTILNDNPSVSSLRSPVIHLKTLLRKQLLTYIYKYVDKAFYVGTNNKAYFKKMGLKKYQLIFAPHAIENNRFEDSPEKNYEINALTWRKKLGIAQNDIVLLFAGKFESIKNPLFLLNTFIKLRENNITSYKSTPINSHLLLIGSGSLESKLKHISQNSKNIHFLPFQNQKIMPVVYRLGNITYLGSKSETWGLAVNESFSCGRPIIVSDKVGCAIDLVKHKENGWVFKSNNTDELLIILQEATQSRELLKKMGQKANQTIKTWNYESIASSLEYELNSNT